MAEITMWKASDGELFETKEEYEVHERKLQNAIYVSQYLDSVMPDDETKARKSMRTRNRDAIINYLGWRESLEQPK